MSDVLDLPLVTVFIPTYNRLNLLKRAVKSVFNSGISVHLYILDNCSIDGTQKWLDELLLDSTGSISVSRNIKNIGPIENFSKGFNSIKTPYFVPLADDDELVPGFLEKALGLIQNYQDIVSVIGCVSQKKNNNWEIIHWSEDRSTGYTNPVTHIIDFFNFGHYITWSSCLWRTEFIRKDQIFDKSKRFGLASDVYFQFSAFLKYPVYILPIPAATFSVTENQASSKVGVTSENILSIGKLLTQIRYDIKTANLNLNFESHKTLTFKIASRFLNFIIYNRNRVFNKKYNLEFLKNYISYLYVFLPIFGFSKFSFLVDYSFKRKRIEFLIHYVHKKIK